YGHPGAPARAELGPKKSARRRGRRALHNVRRYEPPTPVPYFTAAAIALKVTTRLVPTSFTAVMITTAMSAAIRPYSMAVAPLSSRRNAKNFDMECLPIRVGRTLSSLHNMLVANRSERRMLRKSRLLRTFTATRARLRKQNEDQKNKRPPRRSTGATTSSGLSRLRRPYFTAAAIAL